MKQLLIVKAPSNFSNATPIDAGLTSHGVNRLDTLKPGAITFFELGASTSNYNSALTKNFGIALGRSNGQKPVVITEVDINTLEVTKALPYKGVNFSANFAITAPADGEAHEYVLNLIKKGTVPHERRSWSFTLSSKSTSATAIGADFIKKFKAQFDKLGLTLQAGGTTIKGTVSSLPATTDAANDIYLLTADDASSHYAGHYYKASATSTITWTDVTDKIYILGDTLTDWNVNGAEQLFGVSISITAAKKAVGDKAYVEDLAKQCAYDRGFADTFRHGDTVNPGYYEEAEEFTLNTSGSTGDYSTSGYAIFTLRFQNGRHSAKTRDEKVWQVVHIAVPVDSSGTYYQIKDITTILGHGATAVDTNF